MVKVFLIILILILLIGFIQFLIGVEFNKAFASDLLMGLLSNIIIFIPAYFLFERIFEDIKKAKLKSLNMRNARLIADAVDMLVLQILYHLNIEKVRNIQLLPGVLSKFMEIDTDWGILLYKQVEKADNKKNILKNLLK